MKQNPFDTFDIDFIFLVLSSIPPVYGSSKMHYHCELDIECSVSFLRLEFSVSFSAVKRIATYRNDNKLHSHRSPFDFIISKIHHKLS